MQPVFRFAPSPNGYLHAGHALSALTNEALAQRAGGRLLLRIEDIDPLRSRPEFDAAILEDLGWLGLRWEEPILRQSRLMADYAAALDRLKPRGLVYRCFCSRADTARHAAERSAISEPWPHDPDGAPHHAGPCDGLDEEESVRRAASGEPHAWRLRMAAAVAAIGGPPAMATFDEDPAASPVLVQTDPLAWGDVVLARRDVPTSYHLTVVVDDARQGVTHVVRGEDLRAATAVHRVLQGLLDVPAPLYHHHALLLDEDGRKLAKSRLSKPLRQLRAEGLTAEELRRQLGFEPFSA